MSANKSSCVFRVPSVPFEADRIELTAPQSGSACAITFPPCLGLVEENLFYHLNEKGQIVVSSNQFQPHGPQRWVKPREAGKAVLSREKGVLSSLDLSALQKCNIYLFAALDGLVLGSIAGYAASFWLNL